MAKIIRDEEQLVFNFGEEITNKQVIEEKSALSLFAQSLLAAQKNKKEKTMTATQENLEEDVFAYLDQAIKNKQKRDEMEKLAISANQRANKTMARLRY